MDRSAEHGPADGESGGQQLGLGEIFVGLMYFVNRRCDSNGNVCDRSDQSDDHDRNLQGKHVDADIPGIAVGIGDFVLLAGKALDGGAPGDIVDKGYHGQDDQCYREQGGLRFDVCLFWNKEGDAGAEDAGADGDQNRGQSAIDQKNRKKQNAGIDGGGEDGLGSFVAADEQDEYD